MMRRLKRYGSLGVSLAVLTAACSTMPKEYEMLRVHIADMTPKDMAIFEQRFDVKLRIQNPNEVEFSINGLKFDIELNERDFANGMSGEHVVVPRFGSEVVNVEVFTTLASFLRQIQEFSGGGGQKVRYRLKGTAYVDAPGTFKAPFDEKGEIELNLGAGPDKPPDAQIEEKERL
ncbi:MAG TPA: LEA type 2 family protein [Nitrospira sp.]|nr:LEA type 2 family protein [Nitrospira sp.]